MTYLSASEAFLFNIISVSSVCSLSACVVFFFTQLLTHSRCRFSLRLYLVLFCKCGMIHGWYESRPRSRPWWKVSRNWRTLRIKLLRYDTWVIWITPPKIRGEKFREIGGHYALNFCGMIHGWYESRPQRFVGKSFADSRKSQAFPKEQFDQLRDMQHFVIHLIARDIFERQRSISVQHR